MSIARILLHSSEPVSALGFSHLLAENSDLLLLGVSDDIANLATLAEREKPDILLLDLTSDVSFDLLRKLKSSLDTCKIVLWVNTISVEIAFQVMGLGVRGILKKALPVETLIECLIKVSQGEMWFEKELTDSMLSARKVSLTRREGQLVTLLTRGLKNKALAVILGVTENTVKVYLSRLFTKVGVADRFELALLGLRNVATGESRMDQSTFSIPPPRDIRCAELPGEHFPNGRGLFQLDEEKTVPLQGLRSLVMP
jgi:DNA-binding NarL/FixJ family response regulator